LFFYLVSLFTTKMYKFNKLLILERKENYNSEIGSKNEIFDRNLNRNNGLTVFIDINLNFDTSLFHIKIRIKLYIKNLFQFSKIKIFSPYKCLIKTNKHKFT